MLTSSGALRPAPVARFDTNRRVYCVTSDFETAGMITDRLTTAIRRYWRLRYCRVPGVRILRSINCRELSRSLDG